MMGTISRNFSYSEFEKSDTADRYKISNGITSALVRDAIRALVLTVLQPLRDEWGKALVVNSGYRNYLVNSLVGGEPTSQHTKGEAADIACDNPFELARLALILDLPFDQMILYPTFVHFSHKLKGTQRKQILYNKRYNGKRL